MNKKTAAVLTAIAMAALVIATIIGTIFNTAMDTSFYAKWHEKLGISQVTGMSSDDLASAMEVCLLYLADDIDSMYVEADVFGEKREVFNEREKTHMIDVKALYQGADTLKNICWAVAAVLFIAVLFLTRTENKIKYPRTMGRAALIAEGGSLALLGAIGAYVALDFNSFWTRFHGVFFTNDLWLLDPRTDIMIQMLPGELFNALVAKIVIKCVIALVVMAAVIWFATRKRKDFDER